MMKKSLLVLLFMVIGLSAQAQLKVGYTNPELILSKLPEVKAIDQEIGQMLAKKDTLIEKIGLEYQKELDVFIAQNLSNSDLTAKADSLNQEFENARLRNLNEVQQKQDMLLEPIQRKVFQVIDEVADSLGLDLVLNEGAMSGAAFIFYASEDQIDITDMVIEKITNK
jgi:outer membrane protein